ncbi:CASC3/Barentsz eIF4AIII binding-domain-containing protein [Xylariales sp. PMI_506]|nr:CASC3/Barentsz eIF4AIII binding-domain-containing protein [Xylariales sp. PMI_506]
MVSRRRVDDEGEDDFDLDDDSMTEGSLASDDNDLADDSDTSNVDEASPTSLAVRKAGARAANGNGKAKAGTTSKTQGRSSSEAAGKGLKRGQSTISDTTVMMNGLSISNPSGATEGSPHEVTAEPQAPSKAAPPVIVSSSSAVMDQQDVPQERRRREHDEYRRKRDEDPSFVPNRGAFFMHDHRHAGPAANGFRPFGRGARGRGRGGIGGPYAPGNHQLFNSGDPTTNAPWTHDMHETVAEPHYGRQPRPVAHGGHAALDDGPPNGDGYIPTCPPNSTPINRTLSTEKHIGNVQVRVYIPSIKEPIILSAMAVKQYTKLPDHRPPLRRDKPVRISLPNFPPRYIFPATDRSFIFIPRAMRPNQQRLRGKPRSGLGSVGGFSRRTSVFGGSYYNGSQYSPSIALSRRSSIAPDMGRDYLVSPTGSAISRPPMALDTARPVVRLPPRQEPQVPNNVDGVAIQRSPGGMGQPQAHSFPQKTMLEEAAQSAPIPMHQPQPQKTVSVVNIESPAMQQNVQSYQQAFHHQVPVQVSNSLAHEAHSRNPSYPTTGTPLSQIPERAIHAAPFQPTHFSQQQGYYSSYQMMQPQQGYYYPPPAPYANAASSYSAQQGQAQPDANQSAPGTNLVAQEVNGMVYYYDASQLSQMPTYPTYSAPQTYSGTNGVMNMNGMVTPSPDGYYYPQPGTVYYPQ